MAKIDLKDKVVLVSGGAKNLGGLISREAATQGSKVVPHYNSDTTKAHAEETVKAVKDFGTDAIAWQGGLTKTENIVALFKAGKDAFGRIDVTVNTVGMVLKKPFADTTEEEFDTMNAVNNKSAYFFIQEASKVLEDNGKIISVFTSLLGAFTGYYATYAGDKAPVEHYTSAAAKEFSDRGISVTAIGPGPMDTPFFYGQESDDAVAFHKSMGMGGQLTQIEDIVPIVTFLATDGWWITGQTILANGGYTTK